MDLLTIFYHPWVAFVWGACWGSFLNVVMYRYPLGRSVVFPPSACPACGAAIKAHDNIPILSWLLLRGRCRVCAVSISPRYMLNEALHGFLSAMAVWLHPQSLLKGVSAGVAAMALFPCLYLLFRYRKAPWYLVTALLLAGGVYFQQVIGG